MDPQTAPFARDQEDHDIDLCDVHPGVLTELDPCPWCEASGPWEPVDGLF
jgi:hypothetical protein